LEETNSCFKRVRIFHQDGGQVELEVCPTKLTMSKKSSIATINASEMYLTRKRSFFFHNRAMPLYSWFAVSISGFITQLAKNSRARRLLARLGRRPDEKSDAFKT